VSDNTIMFVFIPGLFLAMLLLVEVGRRIGLKRMAEETERERVGLIRVDFADQALTDVLAGMK